MDIRRAVQRDLGRLRELLEESGRAPLPAHLPLANIVVALEGHRTIGGAALEVHGREGLLLAVVVAPDHRRRGVGTSLVQSIVARAHELGLQDLHLLDGDASDFFEAVGFEEIEDRELPSEIRTAPAFHAQRQGPGTVMSRPLATRW